MSWRTSVEFLVMVLIVVILVLLADAFLSDADGLLTWSPF